MWSVSVQCALGKEGRIREFKKIMARIKFLVVQQRFILIHFCVFCVFVKLPRFIKPNQGWPKKSNQTILKQIILNQTILNQIILNQTILNQTQYKLILTKPKSIKSNQTNQTKPNQSEFNLTKLNLTKRNWIQPSF